MITLTRGPTMGWIVACFAFGMGWIARGWFGRDDRERDELATMRRWL